MWFKVDDTLVYSVNPKKGLSELELHDGIYYSGNYSNTGGGFDQCNKQSLFLGLLLLSFIPVLGAAALLHNKHNVPSMPIAEYVAVTLILVALVFIIKPTSSSTEIYDTLRWWLPLSSLLWLLVNTFGYLTHRIDSPTLSWSSNFSGIVFFIGMILLVQVPFGPGVDDWWRWVIVTIAAFLPLIALSVILGAILLMVLGAIGILFDIWHLVTLLTDSLSDSVRTPVSFLILALSGFGLAAFGTLLNRKQDEFTYAVQTWSNSHLSRWMKKQPEHISEGEHHHENVDEIETGKDVTIAETGVNLS